MPPVRELLKPRRQRRRHAPVEDTLPILALGLGQRHDAVAHSTDGLVARLLGLGIVVGQELLHCSGVDDLPDRLLMPAGQEHDVVAVEGEIRRGPGSRVLALVRCRHAVVLLDHRARCALARLLGMVRAATYRCWGAQYQESLGDASQHLLVARRCLPSLGRKVDLETRLLKRCIGNGSF